MSKFSVQQAFDNLKTSVSGGFNEAARQIKVLDKKIRKSDQSFKNAITDLIEQLRNETQARIKAITDLQESKADISHTHTMSEITDLSTELEHYALKTELNNISVDTSNLATKASVDDLFEQVAAKADKDELAKYALKSDISEQGNVDTTELQILKDDIELLRSLIAASSGAGQHQDLSSINNTINYLQNKLQTIEADIQDLSFINKEGSIIYAHQPPNELWLQADGSELNVFNYYDLFEQIGNKYGGDGVSTFNLPTIDDIADGVHAYIYVGFAGSFG